jgi:arginase
MPVGFLMNLVQNASSYPSMQWFKACMVPKDLVYIGLRDLDTPEKMLIRELGIKAYTVSASRGIPTVKCPMISTKSS